MKIVQESIFMNSLRAFFVSFFGICGALIALGALLIGFYFLFSTSDEDSLSSKVKILPDANGVRKELKGDVPVLLQINIDGEIGKEHLAAEKIETILLESREDAFENGRVKGILLSINSPGGGVTDSDIIYRLIKQYKERYHVPVFAFVDGLCASGGYYIACAADKIFASDVSLIGSIGVVSWPPFINVTDALEKIGISSLTLFAGKGKDEMNPFRPWQVDEQKNYQNLIDYFYARFVSVVCENRPQLDREEFTKDHGAAVFTPVKAQELGLVDATSCTRSDTLRALAKETGIEQKYQVVGFETKTWWKKMLKSENRMKHEIVLPRFHGNPFSYIYAP